MYILALLDRIVHHHVLFRNLCLLLIENASNLSCTILAILTILPLSASRLYGQTSSSYRLPTHDIYSAY